MGQREVINFLKQHGDSFFSKEEVAKALGVNKMTAYSILAKLEKNNELMVKTIEPKQGPIKKMYAYRIRDNYLEEIEHEVEYLNKDEKTKHFLLSHKLYLVLIRELKILNKRVKHLEDLGENETKS